jgi:hypothetical protein
MFQSALDLDCFFGTTYAMEKGMISGIWNVRSLCVVGAMKSVVGKLEKYKLDLVGVQEVRWEGEGYQTAYIFTWKREY